VASNGGRTFVPLGSGIQPPLASPHITWPSGRGMNEPLMGADNVAPKQSIGTNMSVSAMITRIGKKRFIVAIRAANRSRVNHPIHLAAPLLVPSRISCCRSGAESKATLRSRAATTSNERHNTLMPNGRQSQFLSHWSTKDPAAQHTTLAPSPLPRGVQFTGLSLNTNRSSLPSLH